MFAGTPIGPPRCRDIHSPRRAGDGGAPPRCAAHEAGSVRRRRAVPNAAAAVTAGARPVEIGSHGIGSLPAGFAVQPEPLGRAACDAAVVLPVAETTGAHTV